MGPVLGFGFHFYFFWAAQKAIFTGRMKLFTSKEMDKTSKIQMKSHLFIQKCAYSFKKEQYYP
jgi:hypothetical protein